jgi:hypothetical protein
MVIAIDFDGTCVKHEYPKIGGDIGSIPILKKLVEKGHQLILYTMRSGKELDDAALWFTVNGIKLYGIQYNPTQTEWTSSNKCYAQLYIDDAALGCPLKQDYIEDDKGLGMNFDGRPYIDWVSAELLLINKGFL